MPWRVPDESVKMRATGDYSSEKSQAKWSCGCFFAHFAARFATFAVKIFHRKDRKGLDPQIYLVPITTLKNVGGSGCNSVLRYPEFRSIS